LHLAARKSREQRLRLRVIEHVGLVTGGGFHEVLQAQRRVDLVEPYFIALVGVVIALSAVALWRALPSQRRRQVRSVTSATLGIADDVFRPMTAEAIDICEAQNEAPAPAPLPGDKGRIRIEL
jgi:hypothetical protein